MSNIYLFQFFKNKLHTLILTQELPTYGYSSLQMVLLELELQDPIHHVIIQQFNKLEHLLIQALLPTHHLQA